MQPIRSLLLALTLGAAVVAADTEPGATAAANSSFSTQCHVLADGTHLPYYVRSGTGPCLILIPGTGRTKDYFLQPEFMATLDPAFHLIIVESRGAGKSWPPPNAQTALIEQLATDVLELVDELRLRRWYVGGHSLGGGISVEIAGRRPPGLAGLIPMEGGTHFSVGPYLDQYRGVNAEERAKGGEYWAAIRAEALRRWKPEEWEAFSTAFRKWDGRPILAACDQPVLAVFGTGQAPSPPDREKLGLPDKPNIQTLWVAGATHGLIVNPEAARAVARGLNEFITGIERTRGGI